MALAIRSASNLKPGVRLGQLLAEFQKDLSAEQKITFANYKLQAEKHPPDVNDVMR
jgi:hypothetical protein